VTLDARRLAAQPGALAARALWNAYQELAGPEAVMNGRQIRELRRLLARAPDGPPGEVHLPGAIRARYRRGRLHLEFHAPRPGTSDTEPGRGGEDQESA
jgi:hypothetical protein